MYPRRLTRSIISNPDFPIACTSDGKLRGLWEEGVYIFRGIQYAEADRFHPAKPVSPWDGTKEAIIYGPVCCEIHTPIAHDEYNVPHYHYIQDEQCLYLNIWTKHLEKEAKRPVMVWIHGGGFATGSSIELYAYDGFNLADWGDAVVVSVNHRLNCLGYLDLSAYGEEYRYSGNLGQLDLVEALRWIQRNITAFGGDPDNVTIMGQSGGGAKVEALLQTPCTKGLFSHAVIQSGLMMNAEDTLPEESRALAAKVVENLGLTTENIKEIETIPYYKLARAAQAAGGAFSFRPVKDNDFYMGSGQCNPFIEEHKNTPVLAGSVLGEFDQNYNKIYAPGSKNDWDDALADRLLEENFGSAKESVLIALKKAYPDMRPADALFINTSCRIASRDYCVKRMQEGCAPAYNWLFNLECPLNSGTIPWHNAEEAYMFHNANYLEASYIPGVSEQLQDQMTGAWLAFAACGDPNHIGMPLWHPCTEESHACMIFDRKTREEMHHDDDLMAVIPPRPFVSSNARKPQSTFGGGPRQSI